MSRAIVLAIAALAQAPEPGAQPAVRGSAERAGPKSELWAGRALLVGHRAVPFLGKVEARTESFVLAKVTRVGATMRLEQTSCVINLSNAAGVKLSLNPDAPQRLPAMQLVFDKRRDGMWYQRTVSAGWKSEDVDGDQKPGMTVNVDAPLCGGAIYVGLETRNVSRGTTGAGGGMKGEMKAEVKQTILGTSGACLSIIAKPSEEKARGTFAYLPVDSGATCESLARDGWPKGLSETTSSSQ